MGELITYLTFDGNCREAMEFYRDCLGGELRFQTLRESPETERLPERMKAYIVQASLKKANFVLMGSDMTDEEVLQGNSVSILLNCTDKDLIKSYYQNLQKDGKATHPLKESHGGDLFGGLNDKYGNHWLFQCEKL